LKLTLWNVKQQGGTVQTPNRLVLRCQLLHAIFVPTEAILLSNFRALQLSTNSFFPNYIFQMMETKNAHAYN